MAIVFRTRVIISESFRDLLKRHQYEKLLMDVLNKSKTLISNLPLTYIENQANGECDFVDGKGTKYEIKLLIDKKQGALIGDRNNDLIDWIKSMMNEEEEYSESIERRDLSFIHSTKLYNLMSQRIESVNSDENAILFIPYPIVYDQESSIFIQLATDFLQAVYDNLCEDGVVACQSVFFIYPSIDRDIIVLRNAKTRAREFIRSPEISQYICFETSAIIESDEMQ